MQPQVTLTILELGSSPTAWAYSGRAATDDWVVVAQQRDESSAALTSRVVHRAARLTRERAEICGLEIYSPIELEQNSGAKLWLVHTLLASGHLARGALITLWFDETQICKAAEVTETVTAHLRPLLRAAGIALAVRFHENAAHRNEEERSGIHARPDVEELPAVSSAF